MHLKNIEIQNFRLLQDISLVLEKHTTVVVGRNNSGKTSLTEIMRRILEDGSPSFRFEDFSFGTHQAFWAAFESAAQGKEESEVRKILPTIELRLTFGYDGNESLGTLGEFVIDLDPDCTEALVVASYGLRDGKLHELFAGLKMPDAAATPEQVDSAKKIFFKELRDRVPGLVPGLFVMTFTAVDPNDANNTKVVDGASIRRLCGSGFISAQRGLDDISQKDRVVIGKVLENLFATAKSNAADTSGHSIAAELEQAVADIQDKIGTGFNVKLDELLPALSIFGYPSLGDQQKLRTETTLDVNLLLTNHTKVRYSGVNGVHLPEAYNGLGTRNLILILLRLREFFKNYSAAEPQPKTHVIFIEEPEVHLHPQMQEVFIRKLDEIAAAFSDELGSTWPVQFVISTHSSHLANEAHFEAIRYFFVRTTGEFPRTVIKDLRKGLARKVEPDREFLHQYMTLTRCDLFFADKAVLIEGTSERLLLPRMIEKLETRSDGEKLSSQYLSVIEIGGAYAHIFFDLLDFLEIKTLIITDIDSVKFNRAGKHEKCQVRDGEHTSNACIKAWFRDNLWAKDNVTPKELLAVKPDAKTTGKRRIAYQLPEHDGGPCGRSFEDAFMLANADLFQFAGTEPAEIETQAWEAAKGEKKSDFALTYALKETVWKVPRYIAEGLRWLAENATPPPPAAIVSEAVGASP